MRCDFGHNNKLSSFRLGDKSFLLSDSEREFTEDNCVLAWCKQVPLRDFNTPVGVASGLSSSLRKCGLCDCTQLSLTVPLHSVHVLFTFFKDPEMCGMT